MLTDCHTHTHNSFDAQNDTVADRCLKALELGMSAMAITDHCEANRFYEQEYYGVPAPTEEDVFFYKKDFESSVNETAAAKYIFKDKLTLITGVELGQGASDSRVADMVYNDSRVDFVIGSLHELPGRADFFFLDYSKLDVPALMEENFREILKLCRQDRFDVLGHLTYVLRYVEGEQGIHVDIESYKDIIAEIFGEIIKNGRGIEINTSGLRQKYGKTFPSAEYIKLYRDLGGKIITFGSDCHCTADLGKGIREGMDLAKAAGFTKGTYFIKHEPIFFDL